jgi:membrane peptidoglycan carboxypeptidase
MVDGAPTRESNSPPYRTAVFKNVIAASVLAILVGTGSTTGAAWVLAPSAAHLQTSVHRWARRVGSHSVPLSEVNPALREAVVATEDEHFYRHHGIDTLGLLRALAYDVVHLSLRQGASTITEQVAKIVYLGGNDHSPWRKLQDAVIALRIESLYSKQQILDDYLNLAYFGDGAYGAARAGHAYFGTGPSRLSLAQSSLLAGLVQAPSSYDPFNSARAARKRQVEVLSSMVRNGFITTREGQRVLHRRLRLRRGRWLPVVDGADLSPGPPFLAGELLAGILLLTVGAAGYVLARYLYSHILWRVVAAVMGIAGLVAAVRSFRVM